MLLLALETAADVCGVALFQDGALLSEAAVHRPRQHAARLLPLVEATLAAADARVTALDAVAVSAGPGSYTGLRIGFSAAQGLCVAADAALVLVPTLDALARQVADADATVVATLPSRRGEAYLAAYREGQAVRAPESVRLVEAEGWLPPGSVVVVGPAALAVSEHLPTDRTVALRTDLVPSAVHVGAVATALYAGGRTTPLREAEPDYLRATVATPPAARP